MITLTWCRVFRVGPPCPHPCADCKRNQEPPMTDLTPAARVLDAHNTSANVGHPPTVCPCGLSFDTDADYLNHVARLVADTDTGRGQ